MTLRPPDRVMRLSRLGASHQTRLSFMRVLLRKLQAEGWRFDRPAWQIGADGTGHAVYRMTGPRRAYSLVAFAHDLPDHLRSDRVIAERWDATFALVDGTPDADDIARLARNVPRQEAGRVTDRELVLSRANRSVRLWDHVVDALAQGRQPDPGLIDRVGYLMRTTAVYGSGKFGAADRAALADRPVMGGPFRAEMLAVWLIRAFVLDLVEHVARQRGGTRATMLDPDLRRRFGIGNSTGLGMAPFLVNHPALLNAWIVARETAFARVRALPRATPDTQARFGQMLDRARPLYPALSDDLNRLRDRIATGALDRPRPWDALAVWSQTNLTPEGQELTLSLMLEPHGALVDDLADQMACDELRHMPIDGAMTVAQLRDALRATHGWALDCDFARPDACARFWYVSQAKAEPRLGDRHTDPGADLEQPLDIARDVAALYHAACHWPAQARLAEMLPDHPQHRRAVRRVQIAQACPYAEIRDNLIGADLRPVDMLRCKLAFFGATRFDPRSDRWLRITMYQNAPFPSELHAAPVDDWVYPAVTAAPEPAA